MKKDQFSFLFSKFCRSKNQNRSLSFNFPFSFRHIHKTDPFHGHPILFCTKLYTACPLHLLISILQGMRNQFHRKYELIFTKKIRKCSINGLLYKATVSYLSKYQTFFANMQPFFYFFTAKNVWNLLFLPC